jgi:hypothetical protein
MRHGGLYANGVCTSNSVWNRRVYSAAERAASRLRADFDFRQTSVSTDGVIFTGRSWWVSRLSVRISRRYTGHGHKLKFSEREKAQSMPVCSLVIHRQSRLLISDSLFSVFVLVHQLQIQMVYRESQRTVSL